MRLTTSKIINDVAKVSIKSKKITAFGGIFFVLDKFDRILSSVDHGVGIEVLEPVELREKMRQMLADSLKRY